MNMVTTDNRSILKPPPQKAPHLEDKKPNMDTSVAHGSWVTNKPTSTSVVDQDVTILQEDFGSTVCTLIFSSFIDLISDSDSDWENDPAVQEILKPTKTSNPR